MVVDPGAVERHLEAQVPICSPAATAGEVRDLLVARAYVSVDDVAVREGPVGGPYHLLGLVPVERVLTAPAAARVLSLMDDYPPVVAAGLDQEKAAWTAVRHGESSLAVVDADGCFLGLVPPARLLGVLLEEHDEDLARLGGYLDSTKSARHATEEARARPALAPRAVAAAGTPRGGARGVARRRVRDGARR